MCRQGYVWREATTEDRVCVTPPRRDQVRADNARAAERGSSDPGPFGPDSCLQGFVWRQAFAGDLVCVTPEVRDQVAQDNRLAASRTGPVLDFRTKKPVCRSGFVWRRAGANDFVCVTPEARNQAAADNALAGARRGNSSCRPGFVWREARPNDFVCVTPAERSQVQTENALAPRRRFDAACDAYARNAIGQYQTARSLAGCQLSGSRWSDNYDDHYNWCLAVSESARQNESSAREGTIASCRASAPRAKPQIDVTTQGTGTHTEFHLTGKGFKAGAAVKIRVTRVDDGQVISPLFQQSADRDGGLVFGLSLPCRSGLQFHFAATDSSPDPSDRTGVLWSNTVTATCR